MTRMFCLFALMSCAIPLAAAGQYWVDYEASSGQFPEQQGWERSVMAGGALRSLSDGRLTLDSRADTMIVDSYQRRSTGATDPVLARPL